MRKPWVQSMRGLWWRLGAAALVWLAFPAGAQSRLELDLLEHPSAQLQAVSVELTVEGATASLSVRVGSLQAAGVGLQSLDWRCALERGSDGTACVGPLTWRGGPQGRLRVRHDGDWRADWRGGERRVQASIDAALQAIQLVWEQLPVTWLQPLAADALPEGLTLTGGALSGSASGDRALSDWQVRFRLQEGALDSLDGLTAAAGVHADGELHWRSGDVDRLEGVLRLDGGELLHGALYVPLAAETQVELALQSAAQGWTLAAPLRLSDGEAARITLRAPQPTRTEWGLEAQFPDLSRSGPRYLDGLLAAQGFAGAAFAGGLDARIDIDAEGAPQRIDLDARALTFADPNGVIVLSGLDGRWRWQARGQSETTALDWQALSLQGIAFGGASLRGGVNDGAFVASEPLEFAPFGGRLVLYPLRFEPLSGSADFEAEVADVHLGALSGQLGWPAFEGRLSGTLPAASYRNQVFSSEGSLKVQVFGGSMAIGGLRWERPFGTAPSLTADIELDDLDLDPLTGAFGFGAISGRLDGYIRGLRMLDGSPVAFDAFLHTDDDWKGRRRISQKAVNDIGSVGGGVAAGLQQTVLSLFDTFGYKRIGLRCRLANNVCEMGGVEDLANGYVLIEGAGLPRVTVNGYRRRVDWPVLLARLQAAASGGAINVD